MKLLKSLLVLTFVLGLAASSMAVQINEIRIDQPSSDNNEYIELKGNPGESLDGMTYIVIGDGTGGGGVIDNGAVIDLTGQVLDGNGYLLIYEATSGFTGGFETNVAFENSDNVTHLLVTGFTGASGDDLDVEDDCVLDVTPWTGIVDGVVLAEDDTNLAGITECHYGDDLGIDVVGPDGSFVPGHIYRDCTTNEWTIGGFSYPGVDTPGTDNVNCPVSNEDSSFGSVKGRF